MVVHDLHIKSVSIAPHKTNAVLVIDPYTVLPRPFTAKSLQAVAGRHVQVVEYYGRIQDRELLKGPALKRGRKTTASSTLPKLFSVSVPETYDHGSGTNATQY
jgi:hypothetical protein